MLLNSYKITGYIIFYFGFDSFNQEKVTYNEVVEADSKGSALTEINNIAHDNFCKKYGQQPSDVEYNLKAEFLPEARLMEEAGQPNFFDLLA